MWTLAHLEVKVLVTGISTLVKVYNRFVIIQINTKNVKKNNVKQSIYFSEHKEVATIVE